MWKNWSMCTKMSFLSPLQAQIVFCNFCQKSIVSFVSCFDDPTKTLFIYLFFVLVWSFTTFLRSWQFFTLCFTNWHSLWFCTYPQNTIKIGKTRQTNLGPVLYTRLGPVLKQKPQILDQSLTLQHIHMYLYIYIYLPTRGPRSGRFRGVLWTAHRFTSGPRCLFIVKCHWEL